MNDDYSTVSVVLGLAVVALATLAVTLLLSIPLVDDGPPAPVTSVTVAGVGTIDEELTQP